MPTKQTATQKKPTKKQIRQAHATMEALERIDTEQALRADAALGRKPSDPVGHRPGEPLMLRLGTPISPTSRGVPLTNEEMALIAGHVEQGDLKGAAAVEAKIRAGKVKSAPANTTTEPPAVGTLEWCEDFDRKWWRNLKAMVEASEQLHQPAQLHALVAVTKSVRGYFDNKAAGDHQTQADSTVLALLRRIEPHLEEALGNANQTIPPSQPF